MRLKTTGLLLLMNLALMAHAADINTPKNIGLSLAKDIAEAAVEACAMKKYNVTATVVDRAGYLQASLRADNAGPHSLDSAYRKAFTSASLKIPSAVLMENGQKFPAAANVKDIGLLLALSGGVPIKVGDEVIGAVGVGGAPQGSIDEECALAAIEKVKARLK